MDTREKYSESLDEFIQQRLDVIPAVLEQYLSSVAKTGETLFPWHKTKALLICKFNSVAAEFNKRSSHDSLKRSQAMDQTDFDNMRQRLISSFNQFTGVPFTIQRICELLVDPFKHYQRLDKFMRGIEKNLMIVTTVDPFGNKILGDSKMMVNGLESSNHKDQWTTEHSKSVTSDHFNSPAIPPAPVNSPNISHMSVTSPANIGSPSPQAPANSPMATSSPTLNTPPVDALLTPVSIEKGKRQQNQRLSDDEEDESEPRKRLRLDNSSESDSDKSLVSGSDVSGEEQVSQEPTSSRSNNSELIAILISSEAEVQDKELSNESLLNGPMDSSDCPPEQASTGDDSKSRVDQSKESQLETDCAVSDSESMNVSTEHMITDDIEATASQQSDDVAKVSCSTAVSSASEVSSSNISDDNCDPEPESSSSECAVVSMDTG